ncbi:methyltransferase domain-containing protein [Nubsella zeaxanthinifaciens]|jgi:SAM-dependent methyltransferase|uniref:methyltransferase domain-containing protein n=1 Tax=Nubsella zeaxanthinifaciens TaxID=392412 RepID=UPI000DE5536F|nr:methyltransferase domain-containing protein [Nubsella zeaxanthinifaciens]
MQEANQLDQEFWNKRWENNQTGWDIGMASPAITGYMETYPNKNAAILIPGCGNAHEASWLLQNGFTNITVIDIAPKAVEILKERNANQPEINIILGDFFDHQGQYDLLIEQTFFCAISPSLRPNYVAKAASLLKGGGSIIGLLFSIDFEREGPPFGGQKTAYLSLFEKYFTIKTMEDCYNSIKPRANTELFINLIKG